MLLAVDVGNSDSVFGLFAGEELQAHWRLQTDLHRLADEWGVLLLGLLASAGLRREEVTQAVVASVVPPVTPALAQALARHLCCPTLVVGREHVPEVPIDVEEPGSVGVDRLVNVLAARAGTSGALIIVDFGTATTFDAVSVDGAFLGGAIAPGLGIAAEALFARAALLPRIALVAPPAAIGRNTVTNMQSGIVLGYAALVEGMITRMRQELGGQATAIATGGWAETLAAVCPAIERVAPALTLDGLRLVWEHLARRTGGAA
ncbi:MAG: type III pantothenate kinase [Chloroflexota bacterium]